MNVAVTRQIGVSAAVLTVGDEVVEGRIANANAVWLTERLMQRGIWPRLVVAVPDDPPLIVRQLRIAADTADLVVVSGGLGWTPDDVTRSAVAEAFYRDLAVDVERARELRSASPWAVGEIASAACTFPTEAEALESPLGGVPGFVLRNVYVLPGAPDEMRAMFDVIAAEFEGAPPIGSWRRTYETRESEIAPILVEAGERFPGVLVGSYPSFEGEPRVEVVVKTHDRDVLEEASSWIESALGRATRR